MLAPIPVALHAESRCENRENQIVLSQPSGSAAFDQLVGSRSRSGLSMSTMAAPKQANAILELPAVSPPLPASPPTSPPPQPRTWSRAVKRRQPKAPLLPRGKSR